MVISRVYVDVQDEDQSLLSRCRLPWVWMDITTSQKLGYKRALLSQCSLESGMRVVEHRSYFFVIRIRTRTNVRCCFPKKIKRKCSDIYQNQIVTVG